jgi:protein-disulfide isomerase
MSKLAIPVTTRDHIQGDLRAACILVEYGDYECPSCGSAQPVIHRLQNRFGDQLSFVFRNFPLREIHPWAEPAAELAEFAATQGKFWEMHDLLFANQDNLGKATFRALSQELGWKESDVQHGMSSGSLKKRIDMDFAGGVRSGVNGTPTFFLNEDRYDGSTDFESMAAVLEQVLISDGE